mmetsp:Transcript_122214/g.345542  ORF Transcript_122214/g.345542 Transcript_122214/m.345542 type:complete len:327 (-) Transcript_122214:152-1132(-)
MKTSHGCKIKSVGTWATSRPHAAQFRRAPEREAAKHVNMPALQSRHAFTVGLYTMSTRSRKLYVGVRGTGATDSPTKWVNFRGSLVTMGGPTLSRAQISSVGLPALTRTTMSERNLSFESTSRTYSPGCAMSLSLATWHKKGSSTTFSSMQRCRSSANVCVKNGSFSKFLRMWVSRVRNGSALTFAGIIGRWPTMRKGSVSTTFGCRVLPIFAVCVMKGSFSRPAWSVCLSSSMGGSMVASWTRKGSTPRGLWCACASSKSFGMSLTMKGSFDTASCLGAFTSAGYGGCRASSWTRNGSFTSGLWCSWRSATSGGRLWVKNGSFGI